MAVALTKGIEGTMKKYS